METLVAKNEVRDATLPIAVGFTDDTFDGEVELSATEKSDGDAYQLLNAEKGDFKNTLYDIAILQNGDKVQPNGPVLMHIALPEGYDPAKTIVYYVSEDGSLLNMNAEYRDGEMWFETTRFGAYALVDESEANNSEEGCQSLNEFMEFIHKIFAFLMRLKQLLQEFLSI